MARQRGRLGQWQCGRQPLLLMLLLLLFGFVTCAQHLDRFRAHASRRLSVTHEIQFFFWIFTDGGHLRQAEKDPATLLSPVAL